MRREQPGAARRRAKKILTELRISFPQSTVALQHDSPLELLVATILSAQCTDRRVNEVTPHLFQRYRTVEAFAGADQHDLEKVIHSTGFFRAKARNIIACCQTLLQEFDGKVPDSMEQLIRLPGVGRKTANVILENAFGKSEGIVVDTHVLRLAQRLGLSGEKGPEKIEQDLMRIIPKEDWGSAGNLLILHGRETCHARKPRCKDCQIRDLCPSAYLGEAEAR